MSTPISRAGAMHRASPARLAVLMAGPVALAGGAWIYLAVMIDDMSAIPGMSAMMMDSRPFAPVQFFGLFAMWSVMMAAMMLPTAAPMILAYSRMQSFDRARGEGWLPVVAFSGGYVLAWSGFSLAAAALQALLTDLSLMSPMMQKVSGPVAGVVLLAAGIYQFTPLKQSCLRLCQTPMSFLMTRWRDGVPGALSMGIRHGLFCIGCCWALMGLLFVAGVMNAAWILGITAYVLIEKLVPPGRALPWTTGAVMIAAGLWTLA